MSASIWPNPSQSNLCRFSAFCLTFDMGHTRARKIPQCGYINVQSADMRQIEMQQFQSCCTEGSIQELDKSW